MQNNTFSRLYLRQNLIALQGVSSTNDYLKELLSNIKPLPEATAIMSTNQTNGKGQRGGFWLDRAGETLALSFCLYPKQLGIQQSFNLSMLICLSIRKWASKRLPNVMIKWPNDIYVNNKKLCGILIENQLSGTRIRSSIIGIGVNMKQRNFPLAIRDKATSFYIENPTSSNDSIEDDALALLSSIMNDYQHTNLHDTTSLIDIYNKHLFRKGTPAYYEIEGQTVVGILQGVDESGRLHVLIEGRERLFDLKEIRFKP